MPRYIDAEALKDVIQQHNYPLADRLNSVDNGMFTTGIFQAIDQMPTISPDEVRGVVHCGECIYPTERKPEIICPVSCIGLKPYDYCSHGVKMEVSEDA